MVHVFILMTLLYNEYSKDRPDCVLVYAELHATEQFDFMSMTTDEDEHSLEMQLPYIAKVMERFKHILYTPALLF